MLVSLFFCVRFSDEKAPPWERHKRGIAAVRGDLLIGGFVCFILVWFFCCRCFFVCFFFFFFFFFFTFFLPRERQIRWGDVIVQSLQWLDIGCDLNDESQERLRNFLKKFQD